MHFVQIGCEMLRLGERSSIQFACQLQQKLIRLDILGSGCAFLNVGGSPTCRNDDVTLNFAVPGGVCWLQEADAQQRHGNNIT